MMKSDAYDDLERELAAAYEPVERDPHDMAAMRALLEVLHEQFDSNSDEGDGIEAVRRRSRTAGCPTISNSGSSPTWRGSHCDYRHELHHDVD
jgi:hypothetical protein